VDDPPFWFEMTPECNHWRHSGRERVEASCNYPACARSSEMVTAHPSTSGTLSVLCSHCESQCAVGATPTPPPHDIRIHGTSPGLTRLESSVSVSLNDLSQATLLCVRSLSFTEQICLLRLGRHICSVKLKERTQSRVACERSFRLTDTLPLSLVRPCEVP
jgi:hypothetical protein